MPLVLMTCIWKFDSVGKFIIYVFVHFAIRVFLKLFFKILFFFNFFFVKVFEDNVGKIRRREDRLKYFPQIMDIIKY